MKAHFEILKKISKKHTKLVISTIPHEEENLILLKYIKKLNPKIIVILTANHMHEALNFYSQGADYVIVPHITGGEKISNLLNKIMPHKQILAEARTKHLKMLLSLDSKHR